MTLVAIAPTLLFLSLLIVAFVFPFQNIRRQVFFALWSLSMLVGCYGDWLEIVSLRKE